MKTKVVQKKIKDHKPLDSEGNPKTRPLSNCSGSMSEPISDFITMVLDKITEDKGEIMIKSTEEHLQKIMEFNQNQNQNL